MQHAKVELGFVLFLGMIYHQGCKWGVMKKSETFRIGTVHRRRRCGEARRAEVLLENFEIMVESGAFWRTN